MDSSPPDRREFIKKTAGIGAAALIQNASGQFHSKRTPSGALLVDDFARPDSLYHGAGWETQNPGYWQIKDKALRRRLKNVGDRARRTGFPFHSSHGSRPQGPGKMEVDYDPSLPMAIVWRRDWKLKSNFSVELTGTFHGNCPEDIPKSDRADWKMYSPGNGFLGIAIGGKALFQSYHKIGKVVLAGWSDSEPKAALQVVPPRAKNSAGLAQSIDAPMLRPGDRFVIRVDVTGEADKAKVVATFQSGAVSLQSDPITMDRKQVQGYVGIAARGLIDFEINEFGITPREEHASEVGHCECLGCWAIGDTLKKVEGKWQVKFMTIFASDGEKAEIRVSADRDFGKPHSSGGDAIPFIGKNAPDWTMVPVCGSAKIINNEWRRNTAVVTVTLPGDPAETDHFYTVWKDGEDVTVDSRIGTAAVGEGTGFVGDVPRRGDYVGRLPQLKAPYKLAGLSCHAITGGLQKKTESGLKVVGGADRWAFRDQPTEGAYQYLEDYEFQIMVWEDDVWYLELVLYPPSTDDAFKVIANSICGPTSRWQMMRHWNVLNPGDHDYGMDDVKGPEQIAIRKFSGLGQDPDYMKRNFQIVHHLVTGEEEVDPLANPKKWRSWKMPNRDFTFVICDSRLWRSSQDTDIWDDAGWGEFKNLYDRTDPTRSLLGEEQFAWLSKLVSTDSSRLICLTGINGLHTIWTGRNWGDEVNGQFDQRDRVTADYAGWVKAGADRVLELLGSRDGVVTVYGDVHNGSIVTNQQHRVIEASFGPIGRSGGRAVIEGFGPQMKDIDGRDLRVDALYHKTHADPQLNPHPQGAPFYWNFLEMEFDPAKADPAIRMRIRNLIDSPKEVPRGGAGLDVPSSSTGRVLQSGIPPTKTLPDADVRFVDAATGQAIRGTRSLADGTVPVSGLPDTPPGTDVIITAWDGEKSESTTIVTT